MKRTNLDILRRRAEIIQLIREFFLQRSYLEVDTALLCPFLIPECSLEVFQSVYLPRHGSPRNLFLIPSPELWMKRLIAEGSGSIFQICKSFRNSEPTTRIHNPEFTMLEWYTVGGDYLDSIGILEQLIVFVFERTSSPPILRIPNRSIDCSPPFLRLSMAEAFRRYLKLDLQSLLQGGRAGLAEAARHAGIEPAMDDREEDLFQKLFLSGVEPNLPDTRIVVLYDYPSVIPTLARRKPATPWAERWELYIAGVEIANCYSEERDPDAYQRYYDLQEPEKQRAAVAHPGDRELVGVIRRHGFPKCSGVALGVDRLLQFLLGQESIRTVLPYGAVRAGRGAEDDRYGADT